MAVAIWDHPPTPDELLDARLARGWSPTPTAMKDGPAVLGHAACLARRERTARMAGVSDSSPRLPGPRSGATGEARGS